MDPEVLARARDGDEDAFRALTLAIAPRLLRIAYGVLRDVGHAEDATQQALVRIWRQLPSLRDPDRFEAWSYRVLVNACLTEGRRARRAELPPLPSDPAGPDDLRTVLDRDELERGFRRLPVEQRAVLVLHLYAGLSNAETAAVLGIPEGTVRSRLFHGIRAMRVALVEDAAPGPSTLASREATR